MKPSSHDSGYFFSLGTSRYASLSFHTLSSSLTLNDSHDNGINSIAVVTSSSSAVDLFFRRLRRLFGVDFTESLLSLETTGGAGHPSPEQQFAFSVSELIWCDNLRAALSALLTVVLPCTGLDPLPFSCIDILGNVLNLLLFLLWLLLLLLLVLLLLLFLLLLLMVLLLLLLTLLLLLLTLLLFQLE